MLKSTSKGKHRFVCPMQPRFYGVSNAAISHHLAVSGCSMCRLLRGSSFLCWLFLFLLCFVRALGVDERLSRANRHSLFS